ncbi:MAG: helix-turn-helix domain-containing protein [Anaerolineae bacterium]|nr:helix-turn-helix domain-containing protein [Anaerolineae bacterium]
MPRKKRIFLTDQLPPPLDEEKFAKNLGKQLALYRDNFGYTQENIGDYLNCGKANIARWEKGERRPTIEDIARLCILYGCTYNQLLSQFDAKSQSNKIQFIRRPSPLMLLRENEDEDIESGIKILTGLLNGETIDDLYKHVELSKYRGNRDIIIGFLRNVLLSGAISFTHIPLAEKLQSQLVAKYPVLQDSVFVTDIPQVVPDQALRPELVAWTASRAILSKIENAQRIGIAGGYTLSRMCQISPPTMQQFNGTSWTPLLTFRDEETNNRTANSIVQHMRYHHYNSTSTYLPYISPENYLNNKNYDAVFSAWERLSIAFVSGHTWETVPPSYESLFRHLEKKGLRNQIAGEFLGYILDVDGEVLGGNETLEAMNEATTRIQLRHIQECIDRSGKVYFVGAGRIVHPSFGSS